jgi:hypothetical protein
LRARGRYVNVTVRVSAEFLGEPGKEVRMISITCGGCGATFYVGQETAGQEARCGGCGLMVKVPTAEAGAGATKRTVEGAWEYLMLADRGRLGRVDQEKLNELGMQGWELATIFREGIEAHVVYYFKRQRKK